jgi:hypothetical protein
MSDLTFPDEVIAAVTSHMNTDHPGDNMLIVRALGDQPDARSARMVHVDGAGADFIAVLEDAEVPVRVPWSAPITERAQVRAEVVRMYHEACRVLGIPAREAEQH